MHIHGLLQKLYVIILILIRYITFKKLEEKNKTKALNSTGTEII